MSAEAMGKTAVSRPRLWFGMFGGILAWTAHLMGAYLIGEFGCVGDKPHAMFAGLPVVTWLALGLTVLTFGAACAATWVAYRSGQKLDTDPANPDPELPKPSLANAGLYLSGVSAFIILIESIPILYYFRDC